METLTADWIEEIAFNQNRLEEVILQISIIKANNSMPIVNAIYRFLETKIYFPNKFKSCCLKQT